MAEPNSLLRIARLAHAVASDALPRYSHAKSPQRFTQAQLMACLVLRAALSTTYRGIVEVLEVSPPLRQMLGVRVLPHYSTLKRFADRVVTDETMAALLAETVRRVARPGQAVELAIDATGVETTAASAHFQSRAGRKRSQYVKVSVVAACGTLVACGMVVSWGPNNDKCQAAEVIERAQ